ncbi:hypothetical protein Tco_1229701 [Tanacetum coccineum]
MAGESRSNSVVDDLIELSAQKDVGEVWDTIMCLRDEQRKAEAKLADLQYWLTVAEEEIVEKQKQLNIMDTQAIDDQAHLANYDSDNEIENDDLGYHSEEYFDDAHEDYENNHSNGNVVKRGITRLYKFRMEYGKPGGVKLSVTFDALNRISGKHRALFLSFLGDMVREHIGLKILAWNKVGSEARDKLWDEITRYFDVDLTVRKLVMNRLGQLLRNFRTKLRRTYILPNQDTPSKLNEVPAKYTAILKAEEWVNFVKYTATQAYKVKSAAGKMARSKCLYPHTIGRGGYAHVKEQKETEDKIKEGTLQVDQGTDAMTLVLGKEKGGYARGVGSGVTYKSQLDAARREREEKELLIKSMSSKMSQTEGMVTKLKNQLAVQGGQLQSTPTQLTHKSIAGALWTFIHKIAVLMSRAEQLFLDVIKNDASIREMPKRETVKSVGANRTTDQSRKATPPSIIQMITVENKTVPKVPTKRKKIYVSSDAMQKEANKKRSQKALVKTVNGERQIQALVDKQKVIITETSIRSNLKLEDAEGTDCLPTATILAELERIGYENLTQKLTFYKAYFSSQWKFLIHTILQCLSAKTTAWNEFSSTMTSAIICLATNQKFNFSKYIFDNMLKNLEGEVKFLMYPRFVQVFLNNQVEGMTKHKGIYVNPFHTKKVFANMKRP